MSDEAPRIPEPGETLAGKYRIVAVIGRGGMGVVFEGHHELLDRRVAIKVLAPEVVHHPEAVTRFLNEARAAARIASERVVQVLDVGLLDGGLPFIVMERLEGIDLSQLDKKNLLPVAEAIDILMEAVEGVAHAHLEGVIHRDLKPSNLFLAQRPDKTRGIKVLDFGISKIMSLDGAPSGSVTSTATILGSPLYMSPEQLLSAKTIDVRADIWSLGVIAFELLTGKQPFEGDNIVAIYAAIQEREAQSLVALRPEIPPLLDDVVHQCLKRSRDDRFPNVLELAHALAPFGSRRAEETLARIETYASSKGLSSEKPARTHPRPEGGSTRPPSNQPPSNQPPSNQSPSSLGAAGAPTLPSGPALAAAPDGSPRALRKPTGATSAQWSSTREGSVRPTARFAIAPGVIAAVLTACALVAVVLFVRITPEPTPRPEVLAPAATDPPAADPSTNQSAASASGARAAAPPDGGRTFEDKGRQSGGAQRKLPAPPAPEPSSPSPNPLRMKPL